MSLTSTSSVERYDPAEVLTDRWEMGSMDKHEQGQYVDWEDYEELRLKLETMTADRDAEKAMKAAARQQRDDMAARNKVLRERPDLPVDRIPAMKKLETLQRQNLTLSEALANLSRQLAKAGETEPQPWHSSNEKEAFKIMAKMGAYGFEALSRNMFE